MMMRRKGAFQSYRSTNCAPRCRSPFILARYSRSMLNFMNQPNQQLSFANGCLSVAEWAAAALNKLQNRGVLDFDRAMWQFVYTLIQVPLAAPCIAIVPLLPSPSPTAAALGVQGQRVSQANKL